MTRIALLDYLGWIDQAVIESFGGKAPNHVTDGARRRLIEE
jgi:hypothetical protein